MPGFRAAPTGGAFPDVTIGLKPGVGVGDTGFLASGIAGMALLNAAGYRAGEIEVLEPGWMRNSWEVDRTQAVPSLPELVGQTGPDIVLGKGSGRDNVNDWLARTGLDATEAERIEVLAQVKQLGLTHKRLLSEDEFTTIARSVTGIAF
jgi:isopropylmalate/homocitrate/citramalate synthase